MDSNLVSEKVDIHNLCQDQNQIVDDDTLFQVLYELDDATILERWWHDNSNIAKQISSYSSLAPHFYFRNLSPIRWRKIVYEFALAYYDKSEPKVSSHFHGDFLKYLAKKHSHIDWEDILQSVYQVTLNSEGYQQIVFPAEMTRLLKHESSIAKEYNRETMPIDTENTMNLNTEIKVRNAGLVLFWPFLVQFFEHLSLLKEEVFLGEKSRIQALYLLQYLAYSTIDFPEHQLVINKVLVGMLPHELVLPIPPLSEEAKNLAESLIRGLINNWEKVKDSTPEAIQETFLQREGILTIAEDKMVLMVNKKGVDVLLTAIPWNISLIKLPWMKLPLYVEWV